MNLMELATSLNQEVDLLKEEYRTLLQDMTSLKAQKKDLTTQVEKKEMRHKELSQTLSNLRTNLEEIQNLTEQEYKNQTVQREKALANLQKELQSLRDTCKAENAQEKQALIEYSRNLDQRERIVHEDVNNLNQEKYSVAQEKIALEQRRLKQEKLEEDYLLRVEQHNREHSEKLHILLTREGVITKTEIELEKRRQYIKLQDQEALSHQDEAQLLREQAEKQSNKLQTIIDTYDRRLKAFAEKERSLEIRDIKLADREAVASTHVRR